MLFWPLEDLKPYDRNARTHSDEQVEQIVASVLEFGWTNPVLADGDGGIVAGHGRCMAARVLYDRGEVIRFPGVGGEVLPEGTVPVIDCTGWSEEQRRAYVLADNQLALNADWDMELLGSELRALNKTGAIDLSVIGFDEDELAEALRVKRGDLDPDADATEPPDAPVTKPADLWICGDHRLLSGDSTNADDVDRLLDGAAPQPATSDLVAKGTPSIASSIRMRPSFSLSSRRRRTSR
ncbi:MAG: ParB/Srx family N-terminal domain-containing protein [Devosia sp.]